MAVSERLKRGRKRRATAGADTGALDATCLGYPAST